MPVRSGVAPASSPRPSGQLWPAGTRTQARGTHPRRSSRISAKTTERCGNAGIRGCGHRGDRCAAATSARRRRRCSARPRSGSRSRPMGVVRLPPRAVSGAGPGERVGNRTPIGPPDDRSASGRPISDGGYRSGAFGVELETDNRSTLGTRLHPGPRARQEGCGVARPGAASAGAAWGPLGQAEEARLTGDSDGAPNKAALGGPSGLRLHPQ